MVNAEVMELDEMDLEMVNGGYSWKEFWKDVDTVTDYIPVVNHTKDFVRALNECDEKQKKCTSFWDSLKNAKDALVATGKCVVMCTLDIFGGAGTAVKYGVKVADSVIKAA